MLVTIKGPS